MRSLILCTLVAGAFAMPAIAATHATENAKPAAEAPAAAAPAAAAPAKHAKTNKHHKTQTEKTAATPAK